ncbi:ChbG/HpnK family deacetylase [Terracidiphilus gabretensis]|uniref:ChbG/HpnK family deacetylase n=1 Tax=Terracidiphilus gabretensis TaxID=1577687 RepID=UPI00071B60E5|nr:ChbG/HpnK family deacetylase [Terracidiphilus gabretensis]
MSKLIVNADDFGLTSGVNRAILELHQAGVLTSTTLMAKAMATDEAVAIANSTPTLGVGCHVVLVDGDPVLPAAQLPTLTDPRTGRFYPTLGTFLRGVATRRIYMDEVKAEATAQIALLQERGVQLTHVDTHKHTHMIPRVLCPVIHAAKACGILKVRNPFELAWSINATPNAPFIRRAQVQLLKLFASHFHRFVAESGFTTTAGALGVLATGTLDAATVRSFAAAIPAANDAIYELVTHPGYNDSDLARANTRLLASRETEREALAALNELAQLELISFAALAHNV